MEYTFGHFNLKYLYYASSNYFTFLSYLSTHYTIRLLQWVLEATPKGNPDNYFTVCLLVAICCG